MAASQPSVPDVASRGDSTGEGIRVAFPERVVWLGAHLILPLAVAFAVYAPYIDDYFAMDDWLWLRAVDRGLLDVIKRAFQLQAFTPYDGPTPFFRPAADIAFKFEQMVFGFDPRGYHAVNVLLHGVTAALGGLLVARMSGVRWAGLVAALLFVASPSYSIAVTWISQLAELMGAFFAAGALLSYHTYLTTDHARIRRSSAFAAYVLIALAVASKESQASTLALFPVLAVSLGTARLRTWRDIAPGLAIAGLALVCYLGWAWFHEISASTEHGYGLGTHIPRRFVYYLGIIIPFGESLDRVARALLAVVYVSAGAYAIATGRRGAAFFFVWSLLAIAPFSLWKLGTQVRYAYLPALPATAFLVMLGAEAASHVPRSWRTAAPWAAAAALVIGLIAFTIEAREQQSLLVHQARAHERLYGDIREKCQDLDAGGIIYATRYAILDPFGASTSPGANLFLERVEVRLTEPPPGVTPGKGVCVIRG